MKIHSLSLLAISAQLALGNLCMMQMANAAEMPHDKHVKDMEMSLSPVNEIDCEHCPKQNEEKKEPMSAMDCANGHCIMHAMPAEPDSLQAPTLIVAIGTADTLPLSLYVPVNPSSKPHSTAPPDLVTYTKTIVLRF